MAAPVGRPARGPRRRVGVGAEDALAVALRPDNALGAAATSAALRAELDEAGIHVVDYAAVPQHHERLRERFVDEIFPVLTPLAVDPGHPFPYVSTLSLSVAVLMREPDSGVHRFARVKVPPVLPRLIEVEPSTFVKLEELIEANLDLLFRGMEIEESHLFRVTRNA